MGCDGSNDSVSTPIAGPGWTGPTSGKLILNVHEAKLTVDVQSVGEQDPYVMIKTENQEFKTRVCENGGMNPKWE